MHQLGSSSVMDAKTSVGSNNGLCWKYSSTFYVINVKAIICPCYILLNNVLGELLKTDVLSNKLLS